MTRVQRNRARLALILTLGVLAYLSMPLAPFLIGAIFLLFVTALVAAGVWYERALDAETENLSLRIAAEALEADVEELKRENDSLLDQLGEVLDEHALCPVPIEGIDVKVSESVTVNVPLKIVGGGGKIPKQREGGES